MRDYDDFIKTNYRKKVFAETEEGSVLFDPDSLKDVVGAENLTYKKYIEIQINSFGKIRKYFESCYFNHSIEFKGEILKFSKDYICFKRIYVLGMFPDGVMFDGKEDHVWMSKSVFEKYSIGDCLSFYADVYRYLKTGKEKIIDYSLRNPENIKKINHYDLPSDEFLKRQCINMIVCETCYLSDFCNKTYCIFNNQNFSEEMLNSLE